MQHPTHSIRQAGLRLDQRSAILISRNPENPEADYAISRKLDAPHNPHGGDEHTMNNGKQADTREYFKTLAGVLSPYNEVLIFGPGKLQEQFRNFLQEDAHFADTKITLDTADHQTDPQMIAQVRGFFK